MTKRKERLLLLGLLCCTVITFLGGFCAAASAAMGTSFELEGFLEARETVEVGSQTPGVLDEILVDRGDYVTKGQPLARLKSNIEKAAVDLARAHVEFNERKVNRSEELAREKLIAPYEKDELETELLIRKLELQQAMEQLNQKTILSPVNGLVLERSSSPGEYVGENIKLLTLVQIDPLNVEVVASVEYYGRIKKNMKALVYPEKPVGGEYQATVSIVDQVVDAASGTFGVRLDLPNKDLKLPAGLKCRVRFN